MHSFVMVPIIYRFLTKEYLKVFFLCLVSFITLLVVSQLERITMLASIGAKKGDIFIFTLYQIPYIVPIAIPLSALTSSMLLFNRLSERNELTALRASHFSIPSLLAPIVLVTIFLSLANFFIVSEVATRAHLATRKMVFELTSKNPLILLQNDKITPLKGAYVQFLPKQNGQVAKDLLIAWGSNDSERLNLAIAKRVTINDNQLKLKQTTVISSQISEKNPHLLIENQQEASTESIECAQFLNRSHWNVATDHLRWALLKLRIKNLKGEDKNVLNKCYSEIVLRISLGAAPLSFALMGSIFGIRIGRVTHKKQVVIVAIIALFSLLLFFVGKEFNTKFWASFVCFSAPHIVLFVAALRQFRKLERGIL